MTTRTIRVTLAEVPTDVLVFLYALSPGRWLSVPAIAEAVVPPGAVDGIGSVADAMQLLLSGGYIEGGSHAGKRLWRITDAGRTAVAEAIANEVPS